MFLTKRMVMPESHIPRIMAGMMNITRFSIGSSKKEIHVVLGDQYHHFAGKTTTIVPSQKLGIQMKKIEMLLNI